MKMIKLKSILFKPIQIRNGTLVLAYILFAIYLFTVFTPASNIFLEYLLYIIFGASLILGITRNITKRNWKYLKLIGITTFLISLVTLLSNLIVSSQISMEAYLRDDLTYFDLKLYKPGLFVNNVYQIIGFRDRFIGFYEIDKDTIHFKSKLYDIDVFPSRLLNQNGWLLPIENGKKTDFKDKFEFKITKEIKTK
jgi:hypothetical protein